MKKEEEFAHKNDKTSLDHTKLNLAFDGRYYIVQNKVVDQIIKGERLMGASQLNIAEAMKDLRSYKKRLLDHMSNVK